MLNYQALTLPQTESFEITALFRAQGILLPTSRQMTRLRRWLEDHDYILDRIRGRDEYWTKRGNPSRNADVDIHTYTEETFAEKFFPGIIRPLNRDKQLQMRKIMLSRGYRPRNNYEYWSQKLQRRAYMPIQQAQPQIPKYIRIPRGSFNLLDFLALNKMRRYPENFKWAKEELARRQIDRIHGTHRYAATDRRGALPAPVTGLWRVPGEAFTTYQFQQHNNAVKPSADEWRSATQWLAQQGFIFDPKWKRWRRNPDLGIYQSTLNSRAEIAGRK